MDFQNGIFITAFPKSPQKAQADAGTYYNTIIEHMCKLYIFKNATPANHWKTSLYSAFSSINRIKVKYESGKYTHLPKDLLMEIL